MKGIYVVIPTVVPQAGFALEESKDPSTLLGVTYYFSVIPTVVEESPDVSAALDMTQMGYALEKS